MSSAPLRPWRLWIARCIVTPMTPEVDEAVTRLRAIALLAPGYAPALLNLAGEIESAAEDGEGAPEAAAVGISAERWAARISSQILGGARHA